MTSALGAAAVTLKGDDFAEPSPLAITDSEYPVPAASMASPENVATP